MQKEGVTEPTITKCGLRIVFVPNNYGSLRFCVDYGRLTSVTERDSYPIPRMDKCIESLEKAQMFSTLHANLKDWKFEKDDKGVNETLFVTHHKLLKYTHMPLEQRNVLVTLQRAMDVILASVKRQFALVFVHNNIVFSKAPKGHPKHIAEV